MAWIFQADGSLKRPYKADLSAFLFEPSFKSLVGPALHAKMDIVRPQGNLAVHSSRAVAAQDATGALRELFHVCSGSRAITAAARRRGPRRTFCSAWSC